MGILVLLDGAEVSILGLLAFASRWVTAFVVASNGMENGAEGGNVG